ncbi:hypothetical protein F5144DRAFT_223715 [Chaetomium tenue]|uniref:Uncharacterized protein n=1 Tax=Chaetomium tenue TaxID=1854479 RepID=A0ACB7P9P7_9PEZI|nr:hypothetical protein F5144DRAFT_223715 [Chaetomium globosum]
MRIRSKRAPSGLGPPAAKCDKIDIVHVAHLPQLECSPTQCQSGFGKQLGNGHVSGAITAFRARETSAPRHPELNSQTPQSLVVCNCLPYSRVGKRGVQCPDVLLASFVSFRGRPRNASGKYISCLMMQQLVGWLSLLTRSPRVQMSQSPDAKPVVEHVYGDDSPVSFSLNPFANPQRRGYHILSPSAKNAGKLNCGSSSRVNIVHASAPDLLSPYHHRLVPFSRPSFLA